MELSTFMYYSKYLLKDVDSLLYVDADTLFLTAPEKIWSHFNKMDSAQVIGMALEFEIPNTGFYFEYSQIPFYGTTGKN